MNLHLAMGLFALYVVIVSLVRLMASREFPRLTAMKKVWGRSRGVLLHFISNVALPLVLGIVFMSRGIVGIGSVQAPGTYEPSSWKTSISALTAPPIKSEASPHDSLDEADETTVLAFASPMWPHAADVGGLPLLPP
jgi:hypothetical protein